MAKTLQLACLWVDKAVKRKSKQKAAAEIGGWWNEGERKGGEETAACKQKLEQLTKGVLMWQQTRALMCELRYYGGPCGHLKVRAFCMMSYC